MRLPLPEGFSAMVRHWAAADKGPANRQYKYLCDAPVARNGDTQQAIARANCNERVEGIDAGADDCLGKPFQMEELVARLRALLRRSGGQKTTTLEAGPLRIDLRQMRVSVDGRPLKITPILTPLLTVFLAIRCLPCRSWVCSC